MVTISGYYENLMNAQDKLSEIVENDDTERTDLEWDQWVDDTIRMLSEEFGVSVIDLDEFYQFI
jgi:hypothetical protein|tara:strand:- start:1085 stop:1276 length:192 start_codon:yes stop_codon:yes gene_type:complete